MDKTRLPWLDALKFFGMFYIYIGHLGAAAGKIYPFVFSFHVPLFFFISGLVATRVVESRDLGAVVRKAFKALILPYFVFSLLGVAVLMVKYQHPPRELLAMLRQVLFGIRNDIPLGSLWFLPCLFLVIVCHALLERLLRKRLAVLVVAFLFYATSTYWWSGEPSLFFNADSALYFLAYYSFGAWVSAGRIDRFLLSPRYAIRAAKAVLLIASSGAMAYVYFVNLYEPFKSVGFVPLQYAGYFAMTVLLFVPSIALASVTRLPPLLLLGENSILLCGTEQVAKLSLLASMSLLGLIHTIQDPFGAVVFTALCFAFSYATFLQAYLSVKRLSRQGPPVPG